MLNNVFSLRFARYAADIPSYLKVLAEVHHVGVTKESSSRIRLRHPFPCCVSYRRNTSDISVIREVLVEQAYAMDMPAPPKVILDFGANIGLATLYFARMYPDAAIHAFEPVPDNFALLSEQCSVNKLNNVICHAFGLSDCDKSLNLSVSQKGRYSDFHLPEAGEDRVETLLVQVRNVVTVLRDLGIATVDLLKIDVEGAEVEIFKALGDRMSTIRCITGELHVHDGDVDRLWGLVDVLRRTHVVDAEKVFGNNCVMVRAWSRSWINEVRPGWKALPQNLE